MRNDALNGPCACVIVRTADDRTGKVFTVFKTQVTNCTYLSLAAPGSRSGSNNILRPSKNPKIHRFWTPQNAS